ncbi:MAG TPA: hypothetical protein VFS75_01365 [Candidatus Paceibacterota bacterium]|nr:hypothetical protein [Candidatus Paceibacterota bacterium]
MFSFVYSLFGVRQQSYRVSDRVELMVNGRFPKPKRQYIFILKRRYTFFNGGIERVWVYIGPVYEPDGERIRCVHTEWRVPESALAARV